MPSLTGKHSGTGPAANTSVIHSTEGVDNVLIIDTCLPRLIQLIGKDVEHQLAVTVRIDVPVRFEVEKVLEIGRIYEVARCREADSVRAVNVEWLCFGTSARTYTVGQGSYVLSGSPGSIPAVGYLRCPMPMYPGRSATREPSSRKTFEARPFPLHW